MFAKRLKHLNVLSIIGSSNLKQPAHWTLKLLVDFQTFQTFKKRVDGQHHPRSNQFPDKTCTKKHVQRHEASTKNASEHTTLQQHVHVFSNIQKWPQSCYWRCNHPICMQNLTQLANTQNTTSAFVPACNISGMRIQMFERFKNTLSNSQWLKDKYFHAPSLIESSPHSCLRYSGSPTAKITMQTTS